MNCELVKIEANIPKETYESLVVLTKRQNANLSNNIGRLIALGIAATYESYPSLLERKEQNGD